MSLAIKAARSRYSGDPGLFDFLGKAVKGIAGAVGGAAKGFLSGGPLGAVTGAVVGSGVLGSRVSPRTATVVARQPVLKAGKGFTGVQGGITLPGGTRIGGSLGTGGIPMMGGGGGGPVARMNGGCPTGYHPYKDPDRSDDCTRNRHMNPLNPRALSRALRRITSAKRATKFLSRVTVRKACRT